MRKISIYFFLLKFRVFKETDSLNSFRNSGSLRENQKPSKKERRIDDTTLILFFSDS